MESAAQLYSKWNKASKNVNKTSIEYEATINSLRSKKKVYPSDIKNLVNKFNNYQNAKLEQNTYMAKLHRANFNESLFKGKSYTLSKSAPKKNVKSKLKEKYGSNRTLRQRVKA